MRPTATPVAIGGSCAAMSARAGIEHRGPFVRTYRQMSTTIFSMLLVGAGSGALALATVRVLALVFPRARGSV